VVEGLGDRFYSLELSGEPALFKPESRLLRCYTDEVSQGSISVLNLVNKSRLANFFASWRSTGLLNAPEYDLPHSDWLMLMSPLGSKSKLYGRLVTSVESDRWVQTQSWPVQEFILSDKAVLVAVATP
jgi:hypothetical protein